MSLTDKQKDAVRSSWKQIEGDWKTNGPEFFIRLFNTYPVTKTFFKTIESMNDAELRTSPKLKAHAVNFKHGVTSFVDNLDDVECLTVLIHKLTDNHFRRKVLPEQFQDAFSLFIMFAKDVAKIDAETAEAWKTTFAIVHSILAARMAELANSTK